jgi:uncharacterized protein YndB with AHSA1/START domain
MGRYTFAVHVEAPPAVVFDLWTNLERAPEWVGGLKGYTDITGPIDVAGTRYTAWFGSMSSPTEVIDAERPHRYATRFGNRLLRGTNSTTFEAEGSGTRLTQTFATQGLIPGIMAWIFAHGSYSGSFRGELQVFARLAEAEAAAVRKGG